MTAFRAGAAKVDMTPAADALPQGFSRIVDNLFCRAIVIENGETGAALISVDWGMVSNDTHDKWTRQIEETTGIPAKNIFISPSHTHAAPFGEVLEGANASVIEAVKKAKANMQPARISYGTGLCHLNINRDVIDPVTRLWSQGPNYEGASDKTVAVIKFENMQGEPIAVYYNYSMHANTMFMGGSISADFPGETSKYVEEYHDNKLVALYSSGAAGDQNPVSIRPMTDVGRKRVESLMANGKASELNAAIMMGGDAEIKIDEKVLVRQAQMIVSLGQILGEEVLRVMELPQRADSVISIHAAQRTVTCPGRERTNTGREGAPDTYVDGAPVNIKISLLRLGNIALTGVNAELYDIIGQHIKKESPLTNTVVATITNGAANSGYIPSDDAFQRYTFQVLSSRLKPNCAEVQIINGLTEMIKLSEP
ncbi:MAG: neutral/alkaline non-lysosomal ceramidase N-terminal domain-containing protein [Tannerella sp.]|nr:neutral/alkaline non-lysosomal ceramidase N-terminal domain-containing protein [Tannerella sp.]